MYSSRLGVPDDLLPSWVAALEQMVRIAEAVHAGVCGKVVEFAAEAHRPRRIPARAPSSFSRFANSSLVVMLCEYWHF